MDTPELTDIVAIVLAGGQGTRLYELTGRECKPALPFARFHRIVDFTLASLARSGVGRVIVGTQYRPATLAKHVESVWAPLWEGGLSVADGAVVRPSRGYEGTADVLRSLAPQLDAVGARELLVLAADHVYAMDYRHFVAAHRESGAPLTLAAMPVTRAEAGRYGIVTEGPGHRIAGFAEKPTTPASIFGDPDHSLASLGIYVIDWPWLRDLLQDPAVLDFGEDVIPRAVRSGDAAVWRWDGYWRDVGTLDGLRESWLDFEASPPPCQRPFVPGMHLDPSATLSPREPFHASVNLGGLRLMSPLVGSEDPNRWTAIDQSVVMPGARVSPGVRLSKVILAPGAVVPHGMHIGEDPEEDRRWFRVSGDTTLVTSAMLARRGAMKTPVFPLMSGRNGRARKAQGV